jgi:hypothetical protein
MQSLAVHWKWTDFSDQNVASILAACVIFTFSLVFKPENGVELLFLLNVGDCSRQHALY